MQKRAIKTLQGCLEETDLMWLPTTKAWELNERHYGQFFPSGDGPLYFRETNPLALLN